MSAIGAVIAGVAAKVGAKLVGRAVGGTFGPAGGDLAERVIGTIAGRLGVPVDDIPTQPEERVTQAVRETERTDMPEILDAHLRQLAEMNAQFRAEMTAEPAWTWAWRPAGMWLFNGLVVWYVVAFPLLNLVLAAFNASERLTLIVDVSTFATLYMFFCGFYMGGHTAKDVFSKVRDGIASWKAKP